MQLWTFGLLLLLVSTTWMSLSMAEDDPDESDEGSGPEGQCGGESESSDDHHEDKCVLFKKVKCYRGAEKGQGRGKPNGCTLISKYCYCSPTCSSYTHKTTAETERNSITRTIYLCPISTIFSTPSTTMDRLLTRISIPTKSISPSSTLTTAEHTSKNGDDDDDECEDDDGDDDCDDADDDCVEVSTKVTVSDPGSADEDFIGSQSAKFASRQKSSCKTSSVVQNMKTSDSSTLLRIPSSIITSSSMYHLVQSSSTSSRISPSTTQSVFHPVNTSKAIPPVDGNRTVISTKIKISPSSKFTRTALILTTHQKPSMNRTLMTTATPPVDGNGTLISTKIKISPSSKFTRTASILTTHQKPSMNRTLTSTATPPVDGNGTVISTKIKNSPSLKFNRTASILTTHQKASMNRTLMGTKIISPSTLPGTFSATSPGLSSTLSPTPPLSTSVNLESSASLTSVVLSTTLQSSVVNSTVFLSSFNGTVNQTNSITPTMATTVLPSSSVIKQRTVFCAGSETGDKFEKGVLTWPRTPAGNRANMTCPYNKNRTAIAYRWCRMGNNTHYWDKVNNDHCSVLEKDTSIDKLTEVDINEENEGTVAVLVDYITSTSNATVDLVKSGADILEKLVDDAKNLSKIRKEVLSSVSNVMNADPTILAAANKKHNSTTRILKFIGKLMDEMSLGGQTRVRENLTNLVAEAWDVANMSNLTFESNSNNKDEESLVSVTLPSSLLQRYKQRRRITFINFLNDNLFPQSGDKERKFINSKIVSASVKEDEVKNLSDPVMIEFKMTNKSFAKNCSCVFWDFEANGGLGQWSRNGCVYEIIGDGRARCNCSHLTHFGILVDLFPDEKIGETDRLVLESITFVGCYLSIVGLMLTIVTFLSLKQYRNGVSGQILLNLCLALLFALVVFLGGIEQVDDESTCIAVAALLHYFVLAAVFWMGVEAFHMFVNIVLDRLPGELRRTFVLKCAVVAWVVPMFIVVITVLVNTDDYKDEEYCRVKGNSFYIAFLGPTLTVLLFNTIAFSLVVKSLLSTTTRVLNIRQKQGIVHFRRVLGLVVIFGITWLFGVLAVGELRLIFQYLFAITNSFQGFMIFILYCLTDRKVRERLARFLCALPDPDNRIIDTTSTQRPTDIEIDLRMFQEKPTSSRPRSWSGTWPRQGPSNTSRGLPQEFSNDPVIVYPPSTEPNYNSRVIASGYDPSILASNYDPDFARPSYFLQSGDPGHDPNPVWDYELETIDPPYMYRNPPGSRPVTNVPLPGEVSGDKLVDSTMSQLERSGGEVSLQSATSVLFFDNGKRVDVPKHSDNNNLKGTRTDQLSDSKMLEVSLEGRRYTGGGDGLSFYKRPKQRHSSARTSDELDKRFILQKKKSVNAHNRVHFSADQLTDSAREPRLSDMRTNPRLKTIRRKEDISENDELDGTGRSRGEYDRRPRRSAQPSSTCVIDDDLEKEYLSSYANVLDNEEEGVSSHFRPSNSTVRGQDEPPIESESEVKLEQSIASSGSETSSEDTATPWSQSGLAPPSLKSYSQSTLSDLDNDGNDETFFTEF